MAIIVETAMSEDLDLGTGNTSKTHPGGGVLNGTQISLTTLSLAGPAGYATTDTWDPGSVASGSQTTTTVTVTGAELGDFVIVSFSLDLAGLVLRGYVSAADTVTLALNNLTGSAVNLASGTVKILVFKVR